MKNGGGCTLESYLELLRCCGGYYDCPVDEGGKRLGPLVGYAGRDERGRQFVGNTYANFAKIERSGRVLSRVAVDLRYSMIEKFGRENISGFCGAPEGGKSLATRMAAFEALDFCCIYPEKKLIHEASTDSREVTRLIFDRHEPLKGENLVIVEDVCNNFSTTNDLIKLVHTFGAKVVGIACFLNRSLTVEDFYRYGDESSIPVVALVRKPIFEWRQDDPAVADDIAKGNFVSEPKHQWERLMQAMNKAKV